MSEFVDWGSDYRFSHDSIQRIMHNTHFLSICLYVFLFSSFSSLSVFLSILFCVWLSVLSLLWLSIYPLYGFNLLLFLVCLSLCVCFSLCVCISFLLFVFLSLHSLLHPIIVGLFWSFLSFPYFTNQTNNPKQSQRCIYRCRFLSIFVS
jgi:hypothetical protein